MHLEKGSEPSNSEKHCPIGTIHTIATPACFRPYHLISPFPLCSPFDLLTATQFIALQLVKDPASDIPFPVSSSQLPYLYFTVINQLHLTASLIVTSPKLPTYSVRLRERIR